VSFPAEGGGVAGVFTMRGGLGLIGPKAWTVSELPLPLICKVCGWWLSVGVTGSAASLLVSSSSSSSTIGLLRSRGRNSGEEG